MKGTQCLPCKGVLQFAKTGPLVAKNVPLLCLFLSVAMMARRFLTPCGVHCTNLHILAARGCRTFLSGIGQLVNYGQLRSRRKKIVRACQKPNSKLTKQRNIGTLSKDY